MCVATPSYFGDAGVSLPYPIIPLLRLHTSFFPTGMHNFTGIVPFLM